MQKTHTFQNMIEALQGLGLEPRQAEIYLSSLENGGGNITDLAKAAGIKRTNIYYHIGHLIEAGLMKETTSGKRTIYKPSDPALLEDLLKERGAKLKTVLPTMAAQFVQDADKSSVVYFRGREGIINLYEEYYRILKTLPKGSEVLITSRNAEAIEVLPDYLPRHVALRMQLPLKSRGIYPVSERLSPPQEAKITDPTMRVKHNIGVVNEKKYVLDRYMPGSSVIIFGRHIAMIDWRTRFGSLTENQSLSETWHKFFEFMWDHLPASK